ncbi:DNA adenine methylase [Neisseria chenwenguii]|nr:DNA adenine methylase [Neisseria chenwenguii]
MQHTAFGGKTADQHFGTATTRRGFTAADIAGRLKAAQQRLNGVYIENEPWERCFKRYDHEHTFFHAAPPYWQTAGYDRAFDWAQYELLAKMMTESKGKVMLSINDHPDIRTLFKDFRIQRLELAYSVGCDKTQKTSGELVICNW